METSNFPIVGIGCSAGGLEPLAQFLAHVPADSGMAFVVIQHLAPDHTSILPELLGRASSMRVVEAGDGMLIEPNSVYVIPPNKDISLSHDSLQLLAPTAPRGLRLPIDFFFQSLAAGQHEHAVGVVLSGMGSDGVFGLRAIKEANGLTAAQSPADAQAASMPQAAIEAGVADIVAAAAELPARLISYLGHSTRHAGKPAPDEDQQQQQLDAIIAILREQGGTDFSSYKANTLLRRIERRIAVHQLQDMSDYARYLRGNPHELELLFHELLIGVTSFFRDPHVWDYLRDEALPALCGRHKGGGILRAWVPACSSGEEAYSLAIVFKEAVERLDGTRRFQLQIYATDLDPDAIDKARRGVYPRNIAADVASGRLERWFVDESGGFRIKKEIRDMVVFATQNIIADPPFTKLDILSCRNLLIYFRPRLQKKLLPLFHYALNSGGQLLLGTAESVGNASSLFIACNDKARVFTRLDQPPSFTELAFRDAAMEPPRQSTYPPRSDKADDIGLLTDQLIQQNYAPAAVLVTAAGDILYFSGRTGKYLEPAAGRVNVNIHAMAREGLREALPGILHKAVHEQRTIQIKGLHVAVANGMQIVDISVQPLDKPDALRGQVLVVFRDMPAPPLRSRRRRTVIAADHETLQLELQQTRESLRLAHEETQSSIEELRSSNEELQSTNEELQSTNEELTTSKEEMQSLNEELQTVNTELQSKVDTLTCVQNDMANLLNATEIATVFLDTGMKLRRFTAHATRLFKLIPGDIGRPLSDIVGDLDYPQLTADAGEVLRNLVFRERKASTRDGRHYRVRIMPYRTLDNLIDGVVITFIDIGELLKLMEMPD